MDAFLLIRKPASVERVPAPRDSITLSCPIFHFCRANLSLHALIRTRMKHPEVNLFKLRNNNSDVNIALETFRSDRHQFDLVITDMTMPGLEGEELAREIMAIRPGMPIILCTGCIELIDKAQTRDMGILEIVMKPYTVEKLATTIKKALRTKTN